MKLAGASAPALDCAAWTYTASGALAAGERARWPVAGRLYVNTGVQRYCLDAPEGADLKLYQWSVRHAAWRVAAASEAETLNHLGERGYFLLTITADGAGAYTLGAELPAVGGAE